MSEAFSLKQFGFTNTVGDPNQLDYTMQDVSAFSGMATLPPMPTIYNNQQFTANIQQAQPVQQQQQPLHNSPQSLQQHQQQQINVNNPYVPASTQQQSMTMPLQQNLMENNEGLFRNNPNNPFFGIPSSMDWTEWNEYNQSNQGNATWKPLA